MRYIVSVLQLVRVQSPDKILNFNIGLFPVYPLVTGNGQMEIWHLAVK